MTHGMPILAFVEDWRMKRKLNDRRGYGERNCDNAVVGGTGAGNGGFFQAETYCLKREIDHGSPCHVLLIYQIAACFKL